MGIFRGIVKSVSDDSDGGRIKVFIEPDDNGKTIDRIPYAFPFMPKMFFVKPKINEYVLVITKDNDPSKQRYYLGPIISQPQTIYGNTSQLTALSLMNGGRGITYPNLGIFSNSRGTQPEDDEVSVNGRKNADIIISDNDVRIRCGCKLVNPNSLRNDEMVVFNKANPAYIKLTYHEAPLSTDNGNSVISTANIVGQHINLISTEGDPYIEGITDPDNKLISDKTLCEIIDKLSPAVYGDKLVDFLHSFVSAFSTHTHKYSNLPPCESMSYKEFLTEASKLDDILSKNVRLN